MALSTRSRRSRALGLSGPTRIAPAALADLDQAMALKLERRGADRRPADGEYLATYRDGAGRMGLVRVVMVDKSAGGMGVTCVTPIEPGMSVTLTRRPTDDERREGARDFAVWIEATAARCAAEAGGKGYRVGLKLAPARAA